MLVNLCFALMFVMKEILEGCVRRNELTQNEIKFTLSYEMEVMFFVLRSSSCNEPFPFSSLCSLYQEITLMPVLGLEHRFVNI